MTLQLGWTGSLTIIVLYEHMTSYIYIYIDNWRVSEASETLSGVTQSRFRYIYLFINMLRRTSFSARASNYVLVKCFQFYGAEKKCNVVTIGNRHFPGKRLLCRIQFPETGAFY